MFNIKRPKGSKKNSDWNIWVIRCSRLYHSEMTEGCISEVQRLHTKCHTLKTLHTCMYHTWNVTDQSFIHTVHVPYHILWYPFISIIAASPDTPLGDFPLGVHHDDHTGSVGYKAANGAGPDTSVQRQETTSFTHDFEHTLVHWQLSATIQ